MSLGELHVPCKAHPCLAPSFPPLSHQIAMSVVVVVQAYHATPKRPSDASILRVSKGIHGPERSRA